MPKSSRRKDSKGRVLKTGESERKGSYVGYQYRFTDPITQKRVTIYAKTFITNIVNGGVSVKSAQYLAGYSNTQVTLDVYADSNVQQACDELSSLYRKSLD